MEQTADSHPFVGESCDSESNVEEKMEYEESEDDSSVSSDSFEDEKLIDHEGIDAKLKYIKDTDCEDRSSVALGLALKYLVIIYGVIYLTALLAFNLLPNPINSLVLLEKMVSITNTIGDIVGAARQLQLQQVPSITDGYSCSWDPAASKPCGFASSNNVTADLWQAESDLEELSLWFTENYKNIRTPGDPVDSLYFSSYSYYEFNSGQNPNVPVSAKAQSWSDLMTSILRSYTLNLARDNNINSSKLAWNFIIYNRYIFYQGTKDIIDQIPNKIQIMLTTELIIHLIFSVILIATGIVIFLY